MLNEMQLDYAHDRAERLLSLWIKVYTSLITNGAHSAKAALNADLAVEDFRSRMEDIHRKERERLDNYE